MICPNKNSKEWQALVDRVGEDYAHLVFEAENTPLSPSSILMTMRDPLLREIEAKVLAAPQYFVAKYSDYGFKALGKIATAEELIQLFYARAKNIGGTLEGDVIKKDNANFLLFPETKQTFQAVPNKDVPARLKESLENLFERSGVPFVVINDEEQKFKGRFINDGDDRIVIINLAYAESSTPFHEYYHPFVRALSLTNPILFDTILTKAKTLAVKPDTDPEELVVEYLAKLKDSESTLQRFKQWVMSFIARTFGKPKVTGALNNLSDLLTFLETDLEKVTLSETTLTRADSDVENILKSLREGGVSYKFNKDTTNTNYIDAITKLSKEQNLTTDDTSLYYRNEAGEEVAIRLSSFVGDKEMGEFSRKFANKPYPWPEYQARQIFKGQGFDVGDTPKEDITATILLNGKQVSFSDILTSLEKQFGLNRIYGKMVHAFLQFKMEQDPAKKAQARLEANKWALELGTPFATLETHTELVEYEENFDKVLAAAQINLEGARPDKVTPEVTVMSKILKDSSGKFIGTTIDSLVQHPNNDVSLLDWKTGDLLKDVNTTIMMQYGERLGIEDSKLNRAYLEVAIRAIILKEHFPNMRFRKVAIIKLSKKGKHSRLEVDLNPFFRMLEIYYNETNPEIAKQLKDSGLLETEKYLGTKGALLSAIPGQLQYAPLGEQIQHVQARLEGIYARNTELEIKKDPELSRQVKMYSDALLELKKLPGVDLDADLEDIPATTGTLKNLSDIKNAKIQVLHRDILKARHNANKRIQSIVDEHDKLSLQVVAEATSRPIKILRKLADAGFIAGLFVSPGMVVTSLALGLLLRRLDTNTTKVFGFMWKKSEDPGRQGYFLNTTDFHDGKQLTPTQRKYRDYYVSRMHEVYASTMEEKIAEFEGGFVQTRGEVNKLPPTLPPDFMPRVPATLSELRENEGFFSNFMGFRTSLRYVIRKHLGDYTKQTSNYDDRQALPVKYVAHSGDLNVESANHSFDPTRAFALFLGNLVHKQEFDHLYPMAQGVMRSLEDETNPDGKPTYPTLVKFLDNQIYNQILQKRKEGQFTTKPIVVTGSMAKILGMTEGESIRISQDNLIDLARSGTAYMVMSFKLVRAAANGLLIATLNVQQGTKSALAKIMGVPPDDYTPNAKATALAAADLRTFFADKMMGREDNNKLWLLAKELDFMPDNYYFTEDKTNFYSDSIKFAPMSYAFMFHNIVETYGAIMHLSILLRSLNLENAAGERFTAYDAYSVKDGKLVWTKGVRGKKEIAEGVFEDLKELDLFEAKNIRRAYERLQGSYRTEEKTAAEATVMGAFLFQFKKFFVRYLKDWIASPYKDVTVGHYIKNQNIERPDGVPVWKWESEVMQGRLSVMAGSIVAGLQGKKALEQYMGQVDVEGRKGSRKKLMMELTNTLLWMIALYVAFIIGFPDDEDKGTYTGRLMKRLWLDSSMSLNPMDLFETLKTPVVAFSRVPALGENFWNFMTSGITGKTTREGWLVGSKPLLKSIPGVGGGMQLIELLEDYDVESQFLSTPLR
jgi:hypothetical protein